MPAHVRYPFLSDLGSKHRAKPVVGSHLGLRISNFVPKKPSNVRISTKNILTFDGFASPLELQASLSRIGIRRLFAPLGSSHPNSVEGGGVVDRLQNALDEKSSPLIVARRLHEKVGITNSQINWLRQVILSN